MFIITSLLCECADVSYDQSEDRKSVVVAMILQKGRTNIRLSTTVMGSFQSLAKKHGPEMNGRSCT